MAKKNDEDLLQQEAQEKDWGAQVNDLMDQINNRPDFSYNPDADPLWQGIKDTYVRGGQRAMEDTLGQAAALTGGYNSTYAQSAGQQQYNDFMSKLSAQLPTAFDRARAAYDAEGDDLLRRLSLAQNMEDREYSRERDALTDQRYQDELAWDREWQQRQWDYNTQQQAQSDARSYATYLLQMGIMPNADQLAAAGMGAEDASKIQQYYQGVYSGSGGNGGGGKGGYSYTPGGVNDGNNAGGVGDFLIKDYQISALANLAATNGLDAALAEMERSYPGEKFSNYEAVKRYLQQTYGTSNPYGYDYFEEWINKEKKDPAHIENISVSMQNAHNAGLLTDYEYERLMELLEARKGGAYGRVLPN